MQVMYVRIMVFHVLLCVNGISVMNYLMQKGGSVASIGKYDDMWYMELKK